MCLTTRMSDCRYRRKESEPGLEDSNECDVASTAAGAPNRARNLTSPGVDPRDGLGRDELTLERGLEHVEPALIADVVAHHVCVAHREQGR
jgi:hypothetical protein